MDIEGGPKKEAVNYFFQSMDIQGGHKKEAVDYYSINGYTGWP